jgi:phosphoglycolate phosphatase-like HAD superfamily hydrolase
MGISVLLFDLDGTLTDSQVGIVGSFRHTLAGFGLEAKESALRTCLGPPLQESLADLGILPGQMDAAVARFRAHLASTGMYQNRLYDGAAELLCSLKAVGTTVGLTTCKLTEVAEAVLDHFAIASYFDVVSGATRDGRRIQKIEIVTHALDTLGRPAPSDVVLVGDREHDVRAAVDHGLHPIGAAWGYGTVDELALSGAELIVADLAELAQHLLSSHGPYAVSRG